MREAMLSGAFRLAPRMSAHEDAPSTSRGKSFGSVDRPARWMTQALNTRRSQHPGVLLHPEDKSLMVSKFRFLYRKGRVSSAG